jgi:hypothetical protein
MARCVDPEKVRAWRRLMARFETSGLSVAGFCRREGLSLASLLLLAEAASPGWLAGTGALPGRRWRGASYWG